MQPESSSGFSFWATTGFVVCVAGFLIFGNIAGFRLLGALCIIHAGHAFISRSVPVGIKGRPASFYLTGFSAVLFGLVLCFLGVLLLVYPAEVSNALSSSRRSWHT